MIIFWMNYEAFLKERKEEQMSSSREDDNNMDRAMTLKEAIIFLETIQ